MPAYQERRHALPTILLTLCGLVATPLSAETQAPKPAEPQESVTRAEVDAAVTVLDQMAEEQIESGAVPGMAIAVVFKDEVIFAKGYGVKDTGSGDPIDPDTVFQLASLSKPVGSTVVAALVGEGKITWDTKIADLDPGFAMHDPWVSSQITIRDLYAHRSGLPGHAGDLLEGLGYSREDVLARLRFLEPASSFRSQYAYTNFGMTQAGVAAASAYDLDWADASEHYLYDAIGMDATSSRYADFIARPNHALGHVQLDGKWLHRKQRQPDAQSPAGGVSSSVNDMANWIRLHLGSGEFDGEQVIPAEPLAETRTPHMMTRANTPSGIPGFYGLGWNVGWLQGGRQKFSHSGAFTLGASTAVAIYPQDDLGIIILTNGSPMGVPEGLEAIFSETAFFGEATRDWLTLFGGLMAQMLAADDGPDLGVPSDDTTPSMDVDAYVGTYANIYFGDAKVVRDADGIALVLGPDDMRFPLTHYTRDLFTMEAEGEDLFGISSVSFRLDHENQASEMVVEQLDRDGAGHFVRKLHE